jgi:hypothetical protein
MSHSNFSSLLIGALFSLFATAAHGVLSSDVGISTGSYEDQPYSEFTYGLNWQLSEHRVWRNAVWTRFSGNSILGLESSLRWMFDSNPQSDRLSIAAFVGPGLRLSDAKNTGVFAESGLLLKTAAFAVGGGLKMLYYSSPGVDSRGLLKSKSDSLVFLILAFKGGF